MSLDYGALFADDPFRGFYNLTATDTVVLTTDVDWAPDYAIEHLYGLVSEFGFKLTSFVTHDEDVSRRAGDWLEVGLHPDNTRPDAQGGFESKFTRLKELFPEATGFRCHRNFFGNNIGDIGKRLGLTYDASTLLWRQPFCQAYVDYNGLVRMSYFWEDGIHADLRLPWKMDEVRLDIPGLKLLNVHPMLMYLNAPNDDLRRAVTRPYKDLTSAPKADVDPHIYSGYGVQSFYRDLLADLKQRGVRTLHCRDVAAAA